MSGGLLTLAVLRYLRDYSQGHPMKYPPRNVPKTRAYFVGSGLHHSMLHEEATADGMDLCTGYASKQRHPRKSISTLISPLLGTRAPNSSSAFSPTRSISCISPLSPLCG